MIREGNLEFIPNTLARFEHQFHQLELLLGDLFGEKGGEAPAGEILGTAAEKNSRKAVHRLEVAVEVHCENEILRTFHKGTILLL